MLPKKTITKLIVLFFVILVIISIAINLASMIPFSVDPQKFDKNVSIGTPANFTISIKNTGINSWPFSGDQTLKCNVIGINETWLRQTNGSPLDSLETILTADEIEFVQVTIDVPNGTNPGEYDGEILLSSDSFCKTWHYRIKTLLRVNKPASNKDIKIVVSQTW